MTVTPNPIPTKYEGGTKEVNTTYLVATAKDTTASGTGPAIDNRDGRISRIAFGQIISDHTKAGSTATIQTTLQGSIDGGTTKFNVLDSGAAAIQTTALSIATTDGTAPNTVKEFEDTNQEGITKFPPLLYLSYALGGTTAGWTGSIVYDVDRD